MSIFGKLWGRKRPEDEVTDETESGESPQSVPPGQTAVDEMRASTRQRIARPSLSPEDFAQRAEARRAHGNTRDKFRAQVVTDALLDHDQKFLALPNVVQEQMREVLFTLTTSARKTPGEFYARFDGKKKELAGNPAIRDIFMTSLSVWLMGEDFEYDPSDRLSKNRRGTLPVWEITGCSHKDLLDPRPKVRAQSSDITKKQELVELIDVFYGLKRL